MASELRVNTLKDASGNNSVATSVVFGGSAKAWLDYNQSSNSIDGSYNVSSVSDDATGRFSYTMSNAMSNANWSMPFTSTAAVAMINSAVTSTQGKCRSRDASFNDADATQNCTCNHGDLA
jgi:hypothetical protein